MSYECLAECPGSKEYTTAKGASAAAVVWYTATGGAAKVVGCHDRLGGYHYHLQKYDRTGASVAWDAKFPPSVPTPKVPDTVKTTTQVMAAPCVTGKRGYTTKEYAEAGLMLAEQAKRTLHQGRRNENRVYKCDLCDGWHLSSQRKMQYTE